jgi:hypothetical protein
VLLIDNPRFDRSPSRAGLPLVGDDLAGSCLFVLMAPRPFRDTDDGVLEAIGKTQWRNPRTLSQD